MKKLFTLIAACVVAMTANAKLDLSLEELNGWGSTYDAATKTITWQEDGGYGGRGWNLSAIGNKSDYQYFVVELASPSDVDFNLVVQYADELNATKSNGGSSTEKLAHPKTFVGVELDEDEDYLYQAFLQIQTTTQNSKGEWVNAAGSAVLKAAYLCTKAEYEKALEESQKTEMKKELVGAQKVTLAAGGMGWTMDTWLDISVSDYKSLVLQLGPVTGKCQLCYKPTTSDKDAQNVVIEASDKAQTVVWALPVGFTTLKQFAFQNLNKEEGEEDTAIKETSIDIQSIYLSSLDKEKITSGVEKVVAAPKFDVNAPIYNLAGQKVNKEYKGVVIQNGKKFLQK